MKTLLHLSFCLTLISLCLPSQAQAQTERLGGRVDGQSPELDRSLVERVTDGGFEAGPFGGTWTESSTNFGTPICDVPTCGTGTGTGPNSGSFWTWFGGIGLFEMGSVSQSVTIGNTGSATLMFFLEAIVCDSPADFMEVTMDGNQEFLIDGANPICGTLGYGLQMVNMDAYADGGMHTLAFNSSIFAANGGGSNFFVDDVSLDDGLPVELTSITVSIEQDEALLSWTTATEENNAGFEVEHGYSGSPFQKIGYVEGQGTTTDAHAYSYRVNDLNPGLHSFRLKQVDFDGTFEYSPVIEAVVSIPDELWLDQIYPNPFNPSATVRFAVPTEQHVHVELYNMLGQPVQTLFSSVAGANKPIMVRINGSEFPSGQYIVRATGLTSSTSRVVSLLK